MTELRFDDIDGLNASVSEDFGDWGDEVTVTQEMINTFADVTGDHQWIHVDIEKAKEGPFGGPIAHGFLTLSMLPNLMAGSMTPLAGITGAVNYGAESLRFIAPVPAGSTIHARSRLAGAEARRAGTLIKTEVEVAVVGAEKPALLYTMLTLYM